MSGAPRKARQAAVGGVGRIRLGKELLRTVAACFVVVGTSAVVELAAGWAAVGCGAPAARGAEVEVGREVARGEEAAAAVAAFFQAGAEGEMPLRLVEQAARGRDGLHEKDSGGSESKRQRQRHD